MSAITFSKTYPKTHLYSGAQTYFIQGLIASLGLPSPEEYLKTLKYLNSRDTVDVEAFFKKHIEPSYVRHPKNTTIRAGKKWKPEQKFSPRCWVDMPYRSRQIILWWDISIKEIYDFKKVGDAIYVDGRLVSGIKREKIALNDGLELPAFELWFQGNFDGQIIAWNKVNY